MRGTDCIATRSAGLVLRDPRHSMDNFRIYQMLRIVSDINVDLFSPLLHFVVAYHKRLPYI